MTDLTPEQIAACKKWQKENTHCDKCNAKVDPDTAYKQTEWSRFGGKKIKVTAYYCAACHAVLHAVGAGEYNALQARAGNVPSAEKVTLDD